MGNGPRGPPHPNCMCPLQWRKGLRGGSQEQTCVTRVCGEVGPQAGEVQSHRAQAELEEGGVPTRVLNQVWLAAGARTSPPGTQPWGLRLCWSRPRPQTRVSPPLQGLQIAEAGTTAHCPPVPPTSPGAAPSGHKGHNEDVSRQARHAGAGQRGWPQPQGSLCLGSQDGSGAASQLSAALCASGCLANPLQREALDGMSEPLSRTSQEQPQTSFGSFAVVGARLGSLHPTISAPGERCCSSPDWARPTHAMEGPQVDPKSPCW